MATRKKSSKPTGGASAQSAQPTNSGGMPTQNGAASPTQGNHPNITTVHSIQEFREASERLRSEGYYAVPGILGGGSSAGGAKYDFDQFYTAQMSCGTDQRARDLPMLHVSAGGAVPVTAANGHKGAYITWGWGNKVPNVVSLLCSLSPYTAAALKFNIDLATGMGPRPMYSYTQYVGGNITQKSIAFDTAGTLLKGWKIDLLRQIHDLEREQAAAPNASASGTVTTTDRLLGGTSTEPSDDLMRSLKDRLAEIEHDLQTWEQTRNELYGDPDNPANIGFLQRNNLVQTYQQLAADMLQYNICFPEFELQKTYIDPATGHEVKSYKWDPKVTGLRWRNAKTMRLEEMDSENRIRHCFVSNQWLTDANFAPVTAASASAEIDAIPALSEQQPAADLDSSVRDTRLRNPHKNRRPSRFVLPVRYNAYGNPYYPIPAWYSIFSGDVYLYASTLISDRKKRRDNANVIGRILYLSDEYVQRMYSQRNFVTDEEKRKFFQDEIIAPIDNFLQNRDNCGKPMLAYTFIGADGKSYKSWEIVEIQENSASTAEANKEELAEISSIILFAWGVDSQLIGNTPGTTTRSGGTDLRERYLLKQIQMSLMQQLLLKPLDVVGQRNRWDPHLTWEVQREVLTTLDNSKTGITTAETNV